MDGTFLSCMILAGISFLLIFVAFLIDDRLFINGKVYYNADEDETGRGDILYFLRFWAGVLAFFAGYFYGLLWSFVAVLIALLTMKLFSCLKISIKKIQNSH